MNFGKKFAEKGCFRSKTEKVNITMEFCIFELVSVPNFSLHWQFWFLYQICLKTVFPVWNWKTAVLRVPVVVTYYIKLCRTGADRHKVILMFLLLLVAETTIQILSVPHPQFHYQAIHLCAQTTIQIFLYWVKELIP